MNNSVENITAMCAEFCANGNTPLLLPCELKYLIDLLLSGDLPSGDILEIGYNLGGTASVVLPHIGNRQWWACDIYPMQMSCGPARLMMGACQALYNTNGINLLLITSARLASIMRRVVALALIDGSHDYDDVKRDLEAVVPLMVPGGIVVLHDSVNQPSCPGSMRAWAELVAQGTTDKWSVVEPGVGTLGVLYVN